jgi:hypothetical protein
MGIKWSQPRSIAGGKTLMITSAFPGNQILRTKMWQLWSHHKNDLKTDGFRIKPYNKIWYISWFHDITETSFDKTDNQEPQYMIVFKKLYAKWNGVFETMSGTQQSPDPVTDVVEEFWFLDDDKS